MTNVSGRNLRSWIESANAPDCAFAIQNLPYGVFSRAGSSPRCGVAIGDAVIDLAEWEAVGVLDADAPVFRARTLNAFMEGPMLYDIELKVSLQPQGAARATTIARTNARELYYSAAQQLAHHAVSGCLMNSGDLLGSGTISGAGKDSRGSLLELSWGGAEPLTLETGEIRTFLEDGDTVTVKGWAQGDGFRIGFGESIGKVQPSCAEPDWTGRGEDANG